MTMTGLCGAGVPCYAQLSVDFACLDRRYEQIHFQPKPSYQAWDQNNLNNLTSNASHYKFSNKKLQVSIFTITKMNSLQSCILPMTCKIICTKETIYHLRWEWEQLLIDESMATSIGLANIHRRQSAWMKMKTRFYFWDHMTRQRGWLTTGITAIGHVMS